MLLCSRPRPLSSPRRARPARRCRASHPAPGCRIKNKVRVTGQFNTTTAPGSDERPQLYTPPKGAGGILHNVACSTGRPGPEEFVGYGTAMYCGHGYFEPVVIELVHDRRRRRPRSYVGR